MITGLVSTHTDWASANLVLVWFVINKEGSLDKHINFLINEKTHRMLVMAKVAAGDSHRQEI